MPLQLLLTNLSLARLAGTETFIYELAVRLSEAGHCVECYSPSLGIVSERLESKGIVCSDDLRKLKPPDVIHAQHTAGWETHRFFPKAGTVAMHHGPSEPQERPHFRADCHVSVSEETARAIKVPSTIIRNGIDLERFRPPGGESGFLILPKSSGSWLDNLIRQAESLGFSVRVGLARTWDVETYYRANEVVAAIGRGALEAAGCGCKVLLWGPHGSDGLLTPANYWDVRKVNFSGRLYKNRTALISELSLYQPMREIMEQEHDSREMAANFAAAYKNVLAKLST